MTCLDAGWPVELLGIVVFFHVGIAGVDDGLGEVNHGVLLLPVADDLVVLLQPLVFLLQPPKAAPVVPPAPASRG